MNKVVEKAFKSLSTTCNKSALHSYDEDSIKMMLKTIHKNDIEIDVDTLQSWLIENSWQEKPIKNVIKWAETISNGGRVQIKNKSIAQTEKQIWEKINS